MVLVAYSNRCSCSPSVAKGLLTSSVAVGRFNGTKCAPAQTTPSWHATIGNPLSRHSPTAGFVILLLLVLQRGWEGGGGCSATHWPRGFQS